KFPVANNPHNLSAPLRSYSRSTGAFGVALRTEERQTAQGGGGNEVKQIPRDHDGAEHADHHANRQRNGEPGYRVIGRPASKEVQNACADERGEVSIPDSGPGAVEPQLYGKLQSP